MAEGTPAVTREATEERGNTFIRHPFRWGGLLIALILGGVLLLAHPSSPGPWPPVLYLSQDDALASRYNLFASPGGSPAPLEISSMRSSTSVGPAGVTAYDLTLRVRRLRKDRVQEVILGVIRMREPSRAYATKGETVEKDGGRWYVLRPE